MANLGNKRSDTRSNVITVSIEDTLRLDKLRFALLRVDSGNGTDSDRRLVRDARKEGVDLDSLRGLKNNGAEVSQSVQTEKVGKNGTRRNGNDSARIRKERSRGNLPFDGKAIPFQVFSNKGITLESGTVRNNDAVQEEVKPLGEGVHGEADLPFVDAMGELAGAWREMNGRPSVDTEVIFVVQINPEELVKDTPADEVKADQRLGEDGGLSMNFMRPVWPSRENTALTPQEDDPIIDHWNDPAVNGGEGVFRIRRQELSEQAASAVQLDTETRDELAVVSPISTAESVFVNGNGRDFVPSTRDERDSGRAIGRREREWNTSNLPTRYRPFRNLIVPGFSVTYLEGAEHRVVGSVPVSELGSLDIGVLQQNGSHVRGERG